MESQFTPKLYVAIFMSDGDNLQEDQHLIPQKWRDPNRGKVPISWTVSPALVDVAPLILDHFWKTATPNDVLVSGPSGLGYTYPAAWPADEFEEYARRSAGYMQAAGLRCITIWNNGADLDGTYAASYARHMTGLLGATMQSGARPMQVLGSSIPVVRFDTSYGNSADALIAGVARVVSGWDGSKPRFVAVQGDMNQKAINPTAFLNVQQRFADDSRIEFVRGDHFFQLLRESEGLPIDPSWSVPAAAEKP